MRARMAGIGRGSAPKVQADKETVEQVLKSRPGCGICLEQNMTNPIVLDGCKHAFCFACLKNWNDYQTRVSTFDEQTGTISRPATDTPTCPTCRGEIPNVSKALIESALLHMAAAKRSDASEQNRKERCIKAMADIETLVLDSASGQDQIQADVIRSEIAILSEDYDSALQIAQGVSATLKETVDRNARVETLMEQADILRRDEETEEEADEILSQVEQLLGAGCHAKPTTYVEACLKVAQIQILQKDWEGAKRTYQDTMQMYPDQQSMTPPQHRELFTGMSQCAYELGRHDIAIRLGEAAIEMNRYFPWSHKYVALAYKASGDIEKAQEVAAHAVVYETPWDDRHRSEVRQFYREHFL